MKVLVINDKIEGGGVENVMHSLVSWLAGLGGYEITVTSFSDEKAAFRKRYPNNVKYFPYDMEKPYRYRRFSPRWISGQFEKRFRGLWLKNQTYDLVLAMKEGPAMALGAQIRARQRFAWVHVDYRVLHWTTYCFESHREEVACMKIFDRVVCVSQAVADSICKTIGDPGNLTVKENPVNVSGILEKSAQPCEALQKAAHASGPILVAVGRLSEEKGILRLLQVCEKLNREHTYQLWLVGDGPQRAEIQRVIREKQLSNVVLWGNQSNPYPFIKAADCLVSGSYGESYGLVLQEALVLGVPVFAATCPAFEECISPREAILVENTEEGIYRGLAALLADSRQLERLRGGIDPGRTQETMFDHRLKEIEKLWSAKEPVS